MIHRPPLSNPLPRNEGERIKLSSAQLPTAQAWCDWRTIIALAWLLGFCAYFFSFDLPNNPPATRRAVWSIVPFQLLDVIWPLSDPQAPPAGWTYLPQRLPAILTAFSVLIAALGFGRLTLRALRVAQELTWQEQIYFAGGLGLSLWSLMTLGLGLAGWLRPVPFWMLIAAGSAAAVWCGRANPASDAAARATSSPVVIGLVLMVCLPMVWAMLLGALTPQSDFDVLAYHLNGPKEWFLGGRISFLAHNVYTSFPFLTEMLPLSGMVLLGDWSYGALAGQAMLLAFTPLTALGLYCAGRRWCSASAGWIAALVWLTTPWAYRITIIAYAEGGLAYYLLASFLALQLAIANPSPRRSWFVATGFLAGSAMACKYPGLTSVVLPIGLGLIVPFFRRSDSIPQIARVIAAYGLGIIIAVGPWLVKNLAETGNPVYPLAFSVFDGRDLDPELNSKWVRGHAAKTYSSLSDGIGDFLLRLQDIIADNDWHSPLLYGLAPLSFFLLKRVRMVTWAWLYLGWLFLTWFFLTHHIDRFWVPMIPVVALLAGIGATTIQTSLGRWVGGAVISLAVAFNLTICSLIGGYNAGLTELSRAQQTAETALTPEIRWLNEEFAAGRLPPDFKPLCIGKATTFHARFPVVYHSVFDRCTLEEWCAAGPGPEFPLKSAEEIRETLRQHGVTHVLLDWRWIRNYRQPGNYGFTDFVHPDRLRSLERLGVLGPPLRLPESLAFDLLSPQQQVELQDWSPSLIATRAGRPAFVGMQLFPVASE